MYTIVSNKPAPLTRSKYPFALMNVGDSFDVTDSKLFTGARVAAVAHGKRNNQKFTARSENGVLTIWRIV